VSLLLDALRQAEKNKALAGSMLAVEDTGEPAGPLSLALQDAPDAGPDERIEIALIPAFDLTPPPADGGLQGLDTALHMLVADAASAEPAGEAAAFYTNDNPDRRTFTARPTDETNPGFSPRRDFTLEKTASEADTGPSAASEPAEPTQDDRQLAESVLLAAQPPRLRRRPIILPSLLALLVAGAGYWLTPPSAPVHTARVPAPAPQAVEPAALEAPAVQASADTAAVTAAQVPDSLAWKQQESPIAAPPPPVIAAQNQHRPQPKAAGTGVAPTSRPPESQPISPDEFIVESPTPIIIKVQKQAPNTESHLNQAYRLYQQQDYMGAVDTYQRVLKAAPDTIDALLGMGAAAEQLGDKAIAKAYYQKARMLDNDNTVAANALIRLEQSRFPAEMESNYRGLLEKAPDSAQTHAALGDLYAGQERWNEAQQAYFNAVEKAPDNAGYHYNLAISLDHLGKGESAGRYYRQALQLSGDGQAGFDRAGVYLRLQQLSGH
jgi:Tfp pilus assembly protein PilF